MKTFICIAVFVASVSATADVIRIDANSNVIRGSVRAEIPDTFKTDDGATINNYKNATYRHQSDGWRIYFACPQVIGSNLTVTGYTVTDDTVTALCTYSAIPEPTPNVAEYDIVQADLLVLEVDGKGIGYTALADGTLVPVVYAHESPYPTSAEIERRKQVAKAAKIADREAIKNSRKATVKERLDAIEKYLGIEE